MSHILRESRWWALALAAAACGTDPAPAPPDEGETSEIVRPTAVETLALSIEEHALPPELAGDATLSVAYLDGIGTLTGGAAGLWLLGTAGFERIHESPVRAMVTFAGEGVVILGAAGELWIWNGSLAESPLPESLGGETVQAIAARGSDLYLGTGSGLWLYNQGRVWSFAGLGGVARIEASEGADDVIAAAAAGGSSALRRIDGAGEEWEVRALSEEIGAARALPGSEERILSLAGGALTQRVYTSADVVEWHPVALTIDDGDSGASGIETFALDPVSGAIWVIDSSALARLDHGRVSKIVRPAAMTAVNSVSITADGAVWVSDGTTLRRFGNEGRPATWETDISTFAANNCVRCHAPLKIAHPLQDYETWVAEIDQIILELEARRMPQDGAPLVGGTVDLIRRWRDEGLRR